MVEMTKRENHLRIFMRLSAIMYFVSGSAFAIMPTRILDMCNVVSRRLGLAEYPLEVGKFWVALAFSMMMTIATLAYITQRSVRKYNGYVIPLLVSKTASSLSSLCFFIFSTRYFAYLVIFIVDGLLFWITLFFYIRANKAFFDAQFAYNREKPVAPQTTEPTTVVVEKGSDKFELLDNVLEKTGFFKILDKRFEEVGKSREDFSVVIKPNFMFMHSRKDTSSYTDPELVESLIDKIAERGFPNIAIVEAQSTYGNYYKNREVVKVAEYVGYSTSKNYRIVDLTEEMVPYDYGGRLGEHFVGPTWRDADFRVSFAKNKSHVFCNYTLTLKNIYGTLPMQNKLKEYHAKREYDWPTIETMKHFPVHFGLIDAFWSADGQFGVIVDPTPLHTKTMIGGESLIAVDWVGATKMGLNPDDPEVGRYLSLAIEAFGRPETINWIGDKSIYESWTNVNELFIKSLDALEEAYTFADWGFSGITAMDKYFAFKKRGIPILILRKLLAPIKRVFFRYDYLKR
ncbi:DUF362 domain-containing protein [Candidatus Poribacteria bacterium]